MYINDTCENLILKVTSIVECSYLNKTKSTATCFFCQTNSSRIILVTNKHVFNQCKVANLFVTVLNNNYGIIENATIQLNLGNDVLYHTFYDICTLDITNIYNDLINHNLIPQLTFIRENGILTDYSGLRILQDIIMLGYPSGIINIGTNHPIVRTGTTATCIKEKYNNHEIFLTDIPTFGGSSGSPIFVANENGDVFLVGINSQTFNHRIPTYPKKFKKRNRNKDNGFVEIPNDIGIAVNSLIIKEMLSFYQ